MPHVWPETDNCIVIPYMPKHAWVYGVRRCQVPPGKKGFQSYLCKRPARARRPKDPAGISSAHPIILGKSQCGGCDWPRPPRTILQVHHPRLVNRRYWSRLVSRSDPLIRLCRHRVRKICKSPTAKRQIPKRYSGRGKPIKENSRLLEQTQKPRIDDYVSPRDLRRN